MNQNPVIGAGTAIVPAKSSSLAEYTNKFKTSVMAQVPESVKEGTGALVGAGLGAMLMKKHRVLGGLAGAAIGYNGPMLLKEEDRREALCNLGVLGAGYLAARMLPRYNKLLTFGVGWLGAGILVQSLKLRGV